MRHLAGAGLLPWRRLSLHKVQGALDIWQAGKPNGYSPIIKPSINRQENYNQD